MSSTLARNEDRLKAPRRAESLDGFLIHRASWRRRNAFAARRGLNRLDESMRNRLDGADEVSFLDEEDDVPSPPGFGEHSLRRSSNSPGFFGRGDERSHRAQETIFLQAVGTSP